MTRKLTSHKVNGLNEEIEVAVIDAPGSGGACHVYEMTHVKVETGGFSLPDVRRLLGVIGFQRGSIQENGVNGISNEVLLAIVEDRLVGFQSGEYACIENAVALAKIQEALMWLQKRTRDRIARGVEGTSIK